MDDKKYFSSRGILTEPQMVVISWTEAARPNPFGEPVGEQVFTDEMPVQWVHEIHAGIAFYHGNKLVKTQGEFHDYYSHCDSINDAFESFMKNNDYYSIDRKSSLVTKIYAFIESYPSQGIPGDDDQELLKDHSDKKYFGSQIYKKYPNVDFVNVVDEKGMKKEYDFKISSRQHSFRFIADSRMSNKKIDSAISDAHELLGDEEYLESLDPILLPEYRSIR